MTSAQLTGALAGLSPLGLADLGRYKAAVEAGRQMGWGYYFPYLMTRNRPGRTEMLWLEDEGALCVFQWLGRDARGGRLDLYLPPIPMNPRVLERCLERANEHNGDRSARILRVDSADAQAMLGLPGLSVQQRRSQFLFAPARYRDLGGGELRTVRRYVSLVKNMPDVVVEPYSAKHAEGCRDLLERWRLTHRDEHGKAGGSGGSKRIIELAGSLPERDLTGEVVLLGDRLVAFAFGGEIRPGLACAFDRKCDVSVRGLTYFHFHSLLLRLEGFELVNDGSDAGRAGLRQVKESFRPTTMHAEFRASQTAT